jgi:hypothetical protein
VVRLRLLRSAPLSRPSGDRGNAPATDTSDLRMDMIAEQGMTLKKREASSLESVLPTTLGHNERRRR